MAISDNTTKINELIEKINSLPIAGSSGTGSDGEDGVSPTIVVEQVDGGHNIIITDVNGSQSFFVADGKDGSDGAPGSIGEPGEDGVGVESIAQTTTSTEDGGLNVVTATLTNGNISTFKIRNGSTGSPGATGSAGSDGVGISSVVQTTTSTANGGNNVITVTLTNGETATFNVRNGTRGSTGSAGANGVGVSSITQTTTSSADGGTNVITATLSDGQTTTFNIKNGSKGSTGEAGSNATINGVNALTLNTGNGITQTQSGNTLTLGASLTDLLASGKIILTADHYGNTLPAAGNKGRLFFKKV